MILRCGNGGLQCQVVAFSNIEALHDSVKLGAHRIDVVPAILHFLLGSHHGLGGTDGSRLVALHFTSHVHSPLVHILTHAHHFRRHGNDSLLVICTIMNP
jgi:hypothetical protein